MNNDTRILEGLYRERARSTRAMEQMDKDISNGGGEEELSRVFDQLMQDKLTAGKNYTMTSAYVSYRHETIKNAINVV